MSGSNITEIVHTTLSIVGMTVYLIIILRPMSLETPKVIHKKVRKIIKFKINYKKRTKRIQRFLDRKKMINNKQWETAKKVLTERKDIKKGIL